MEIIADLHIHSRFSRATSKSLTIENLEKYARMKGVTLLGTGDFQHPEWRKEIDNFLTEDDKGILRTANGFPFIWQTEISLMYGQEGRRAIHFVVFAPNGKVADKITEYLGSKGRLDYDGRPIFGIPATDFVRGLKNIDEKIELIPAHCMTPWFGVFGSKSGFDSLKECLGEEAKHIYAIETGISADPPMLWRFKEKVNLVSFSDLHSFWPWRIGREATLFEMEELSYDNLINSIRNGEGLTGTIETPPAYGKYHWDGHRNCDFSCSPEETKKLNGVCPKCGKPLIIGVDYRVEEMAKEPNGFIPTNSKKFYSILPLHELIAFVLKCGMSTQKSWKIYNELIGHFENEFNILLKVPKEKLAATGIDEKLVELILKNREGKLKVKPGYDGEYGQLIFEEQKKLF